MKTAKRFYLMLAGAAILASGAACSGDSVTAPAKGAVIFRIDAQTCTGSGTINFFIDGVTVGTETVAAGGSSKSYSTEAGTHLVGASEIGVNAFTWPSQTAVVTANATYTAVLKC